MKAMVQMDKIDIERREQAYRWVPYRFEFLFGGLL